MNILFIAPYVPSRIRVRPFHIIKELARRHSVHVIALGESDQTDTHGVDEVTDMAESFQVVPHSKLRGYRQSAFALLRPEPMCTAFCRSSEMRRAVAEAMARHSFDVVHIEHLRASHFADGITGAPVLFDSVDCLAGLFGQMARTRKSPLARLLMAEESWKLRRYEPRTLKRFGRVIITSESERDTLLGLDPELRIDVIPNGVDTRYFAPQGVDRFPRRVVFSGKMSYRPNSQAALWFAENAFPALRSKWDDAEFVVVGSGPPPEISELASRPGITVTGEVTDIRPYLDSAAVAVAPMRSAVGMQNKVLEAMAMGLPVVASPLAARSIGSATSGVIEADTPDEVTEAVAGLFDDPDRAAQIGRQGRELAEQAFSWRSSVDRLEAIYEELLARRHA